MGLSEEFSDQAARATAIARYIRRNTYIVVSCVAALELITNGVDIAEDARKHDTSGAIQLTILTVLLLAVFVGIFVVARKIAAWFDADAAILRVDAIHATELDGDINVT